MFKITHGLLEFPMASTFAHPTRLHVPPTSMLYTPSPIRLHSSDCPILEQITGWDSQRLLGEIFQGTPGCPLAVPVPRSTHLTHLLSKPVPLAYIDPRKKLTPKWLFPPPHLVVYNSIYCFVDPKKWVDLKMHYSLPLLIIDCEHFLRRFPFLDLDFCQLQPVYGINPSA